MENAIMMIVMGIMALGATIALAFIGLLFYVGWWMLIPLICFMAGGGFGLLFGLGLTVIVWGAIEAFKK